MQLFKRFASQIILLAIICLIAVFGYVKNETLPTNANLSESPTIIIDAGHGGLTNTIH